MKELTIEQKAQRYNEALEKAMKFYNKIPPKYSSIKKMLEKVFPELRDSEDEKIRKGIISGMKALQKKGKYTRFANIPVNNVIAWLEKQGEQRSITIDADKMASKYSHTKDGDFGLPVNCQIRAYRQGVNDVLNLLSGIEKQGEQEEPQVYETENGEIITYSETDGYKVVEPKFKIGDWIIYKDNVWKICNISLKTYYELLTINNEVSTRRIEDVDKDYHLWTIQDAKDGDVLVGNYGTFIFMGGGYCGVLSDNTFIRSTGNNEWTKSLHPATKKQRDTLFKKMREAGYEFDFEQKELKKIDNEEVNGEDYGIDSLYHAQRILEKTLGKVDGYQFDDGILEHKCAISAVKKLYEQKPAKIKSKFHKGDWVIGRATENEPRQIAEITEDGYKSTYGGWYGFSFEEDMHLWTIQDAKDGDVLTNDFNEIFIFKNINEDIVISHCSIIYRTSDAIANTFDEIEVGSLSMVNFYPATKEQRDTLMKAMTDAGYTFDFEKKEVRKIKQKPVENKGMNLVEEEMTPFQKKVFCIIDTAVEEEQGLKQVCDELLTLASNEIKQKPAEWSEEDEETMSGLLSFLLINTSDQWAKYGKWLKSIKDRVQPKKEWSEEDELHIRELESLVKKAWAIAELKNDKETIHKMSDLSFFLKTLKPQLKREWSKEDEEMIEGLNNCLDELEVDNGWYYVYVNNKNIKLSKVRNWLKSLKPQKHITDEKLAQAKKDAYNNALDKIEYHSGEPTFDDGWSAAIDYIRKKSLRP